MSRKRCEHFPIEDVSILGWSSMEVISFSLATDFQAPRISMGRLYNIPGEDLFSVVVSIFSNFHPYLGKIPILTNIFQMG